MRTKTKKQSLGDQVIINQEENFPPKKIFSTNHQKKMIYNKGNRLRPAVLIPRLQTEIHYGLKYFLLQP